ncbi:MAG: methyltransferase domain-containing protein [Geobacteraceae bacterium]|nr:methyltransferase domain-containing protein [Geobacteraceae bacterium]
MWEAVAVDSSFNEIEYLLANPDVASAVASGAFKNGYEHYLQFGKAEKRGCGETSRQKKALSMLDRNGLGLAIGPSYSPIAPKRKGFNVHIVDHLPTGELKRKYQGHPVNADLIEDVDFVWNGQPLPELVGNKGCYDWIIASHVIEHVPDPISFLQQCQQLLKPTGYLSLIIPDKRACFDYFNAISMTGSLLDAYYEKRTRPSPGQLFDYFMKTCKCYGNIAWEIGRTGQYELLHDLGIADDFMRQSLVGTYVDAHCWRYTPESFRLLVSEFNDLDLIKMHIVREEVVDGCEFYVTLGLTNSKVTANRLAVLEKITVTASCDVD